MMLTRDKIIGIFCFIDDLLKTGIRRDCVKARIETEGTIIDPTSGDGLLEIL